MSRQWKPSKQTVELRPSRIRREPVRAETPANSLKPARWDPSEWETWVVVVGVILFALALSGLSVGLLEITSH